MITTSTSFPRDDAAQVKREFADFDVASLPATLPAEFTCTAWHHDVCPTWIEGQPADELKSGDLMLCIDYADAQRREFPETPRFQVSMYRDDNSDWELLHDSDDWTEIETVTAYARAVRYLGLGFHVDTRGRNYVQDIDGTRVFSDAEAEELDRVVDAVHGFADPFELAFTIWRTLGLTPPVQLPHHD
jgi:hypothetical protein